MAGSSERNEKRGNFKIYRLLNESSEALRNFHCIADKNVAEKRMRIDRSVMGNGDGTKGRRERAKEPAR